MAKNDTQFEWLATESAPEHYPMVIIQGTFFYRGKNEGLYIPNGGTLSSGWGHGISNHHVGEKLKPLPDRLKIIFFSYAEKQFYKGEFDLPYEQILALFRDGVANAKVFSDGTKLPLYNKIMAGIAPGGVVAVWVAGKLQTEVFFGQAQKIDLDPGRAFALPFENKQAADAYIAKQLVNTLSSEEIESLKRDGIPFGLWSRYRNQYNWLPIASEGQWLTNVAVYPLNGEFSGEWIFTDAKIPNALTPVPSQISFISTVNEKKVIYEIHFDEFETMAAFEKLGAHSQKVYLEFEPRLPRTQTSVRLYNENESIELRKIKSEDW